MSILTQRLLEVKGLHETGRVTFAQAVAAVFPDADPESVKRQIAAIGKPRKTSSRTPRTGKTRQAAKQAAATAALVSRVNEREPVQDDFIPFDGRPMYNRVITTRAEVL